MTWYYKNIELFAPAAMIIVIGIVLGFIFKRFVHSRLKKAAARSSWAGDDAVLEAVEPHIVIWFFLGALSIATSSIESLDLQSSYLTNIVNEYVPKFLIIVLIGSITLALGNLAVSLFDLWAKGQEKGFPSTTMFTNFVRIAIYVVGVLIILDALKISIAPMITALGVGGLAVSLALKDTLSDVFAGLHILLSKKVQVGDFIQIRRSGNLSKSRNSVSEDIDNYAYYLPMINLLNTNAEFSFKDRYKIDGFKVESPINKVEI